MSKLRLLGIGLSAIALTLALNGCGGRSARPVTVTQSFDTDMSCAQLASEMEANKVRVNSLHKEDADRHGRNAAMATAGVLLVGVGALFFIDTGEAQEKEIHAYSARNNHLTQVASTKGCTDEEMAAAVAANSAYAAAAAATVVAGSPAGSSTQVAVATGPKTNDSAAQAQFDAWSATNNEALRRAITAEAREENLLASCIAGLRPTELVTIEDTTVVSRDETGYRVNVSYLKESESSCNGTRNDAFLIRIENDKIAEVSYLGPAASVPVAAATAVVPSTAAASAPATLGASAAATASTDVLVTAQANFDAWYAVDAGELARQIHLIALQKNFYSADCTTRPANIVGHDVAAVRDDGYEVNVQWWNQSKWNICEQHRHDRFYVQIVNDQLVSVEYLGKVASSTASTGGKASASWAGTWSGKTKLNDGNVTLTIVDGAVAVYLSNVGKTVETSGFLDDRGRYSASIPMQVGGGAGVVEIAGTFPDFTVKYFNGFNHERDRTIQVSQQ